MMRTFVSVHVDDTPEMESLRRELRSAGLRASPPEQTHVTLKFIGDIPEDMAGTVTECVERSVSGVGPFTLRVAGIGAFPSERRPFVVWMGAEPADTLGMVADRLSSELAGRGIPFDGKPFKAHVTVARVRDGYVPRRIFDDHRDTVFSETHVSEVLVMRSELGPRGARHSVVSRIQLTGEERNI